MSGGSWGVNDGEGFDDAAGDEVEAWGGVEGDVVSADDDAVVTAGVAALF